MTPLEEFDAVLPVLHEFAPKLRVLLEDLLRVQGFKVHSVTTRIKDRPSLERKLSGKYDRMAQITDLCGARIITYFEDEVDLIAKCIEREFAIDQPNSVDKRQLHDPDRFGYTSVHYVATLNAPRADLWEYKRFGSVKFELQIRSLLQHAWAEIEHDLEYKSQQEVPRQLRRRFARLAGLLEMADSEFVQIRKAIEQYKLHLLLAVTSMPDQLTVDRDSIKVLIDKDDLVLALDQRIAGILDKPISPDILDSTFVLKGLLFAGIHTVHDVKSALAARGDEIVALARLWLKRQDLTARPISSFHKGVSLWYLTYYLLLATRPGSSFVSTLIRCDFAATDIDAMGSALLDTYAELRAQAAAI